MDVIMELMDGRRCEGTLAKPFKPEDGEVDVSLSGAMEKQKFLFPEICSVLLKSYHTWMFLFQKDTAEEAVTTSIGNTYHVHVPETQSHATGYFGLLTQEDALYRLIFFTLHDVKSRCQTRAVGEILQAEG